MAQDPEIDQIKQAVSCAVLLERAGFKVDEPESSRNAIKYRRGKGETVIVNHDGRGWWDTQSTARGDVFTLAQHLDHNLNFGQARVHLRSLAGIAPSFPAALRPAPDEKPPEAPIRTWFRRPPIREGSPAWRYLTETRALPPEIVARAITRDSIREGPNGTAWFAHRNDGGSVVGIEGRGPEYHGFSKGGQKTLFRFVGGDEPPTRIAANESAIEALSLVTLEGLRADTLYVGTGGGIGPHTVDALKAVLADIATRPGARLTIATNNDKAGDRYAERLAEIAREAGVPAARRRPPGAINDWNQMVQINAGLAPNPNTSAPAPAKPAAPPSPTPNQEKQVMSEANTPRPEPANDGAEPPRVTPDGQQTAAAGNGAQSTSAATASRAAGKKDPIVELLEELRKAAEQMSGPEGEKMRERINELLAASRQPNSLTHDLFRTRVAWTVLDVERATRRPVTMSSTLASEMADRAVTAPGLSHPDMVQLMRATPRIADQQLVDEIRDHAIEIGRQPYPQSSPDIDRNIERLRARVIDAGNWVGNRGTVGTTIEGEQDSTAVNAAAKATSADRREQRVEAAKGAGNTTAPAAVAVRVPTTGFMEGVAKVVDTFRRPRADQPAPANPAPQAAAETPQEEARPTQPEPERPDAKAISEAIRQEAARGFMNDRIEPLDIEKHLKPLNDYAEAAMNRPPAQDAKPADQPQEPQSFAAPPPHPTVERMLNAAGIGFSLPKSEKPPTFGDWRDDPDVVERHTRFVMRTLGPHVEIAAGLARDATAAMQGLLEGPGSDFRRKIAATAAAENTTSAAIVAEMRPDGRHAALRVEFDQALQTNPNLAQAFDKAAITLEAYAGKRVRLENGYDKLEVAKGDLYKQFGDVDDTLSKDASAFPAREPGKSLIDTVGDRIAELFQRVVNTVKQAFGVQTRNAPSQGPSPQST